MVDGVKCVKGEIHNVLAVLRLSMRQGTYYSIEDSESPASSPLAHLMHAFKHLYDHLRFYSKLEDVECSVFLAPFVLALETVHASSEVTHTALLSIHKFLLYGLLTPYSPGVAEALELLANGAINCKFHAGSSVVAEILYLKIVEVLFECVRCPAGHLLTNDTICAAFQAAFQIRAEPESSPLVHI